MLVLTLRERDSIELRNGRGELIGTVTINWVAGDRASVGVKMPRDINIARAPARGGNRGTERAS